MEDSTIIQMSSVVSMEQLDNDDDIVINNNNNNNNRNVVKSHVNEDNQNKVVCSAQRSTFVEYQLEDKDSSLHNYANNKGSNNNSISKNDSNVSRVSDDINANESHEINDDDEDEEENDSNVIILPMTSNSDVTTQQSSEQINESSIHYSHRQQLEEEHEEREHVQNEEEASPSLTESTILTELTAIVLDEDKESKSMNMEEPQSLHHHTHKTIKSSSLPERKECEYTEPIMQLYKVEDEGDKFTSNTIVNEENTENNNKNYSEATNNNIVNVTTQNCNEEQKEEENAISEESNNAEKERCTENMKSDMEVKHTALAGDVDVDEVVNANNDNVDKEKINDENNTEYNVDRDNVYDVNNFINDEKETIGQEDDNEVEDIAFADRNVKKEENKEEEVEMSNVIESEEEHHKEKEEQEEPEQQEEQQQHLLSDEAEEEWEQILKKESMQDVNPVETNENEQEKEEEEEEEEMEAIEDEINVEANIDEVDEEEEDKDESEESVEQEHSSEEEEEEEVASEYSHTYNNYYKPQLSLGKQRWTTSIGSASSIAAATTPVHHGRSLRTSHHTDPHALHLQGNVNTNTSAFMVNKDLEESSTPWLCASHALQGWSEMCGGGCVRKMNPTASHLKCFTEPFTAGEEPVLSLECKNVLLLRSTITVPSTKQEACVCAQVKCILHFSQQTERNSKETIEKLSKNSNKSSKLNSPHESNKNKCSNTTTTTITTSSMNDDDTKKEEELEELYEEEEQQQNSRAGNCVFFGIGLTTRANEEIRSFPLTLLQFDDEDGTAVLSVNSWKVTERDTLEQIMTIKSPIPIRLAHDSVMLKLVIRENEFDVWCNDILIHASIVVNNLKLGVAFPLLLNSGGPVVLRHVTVSSGNHPPESRVFQLSSTNTTNTQIKSPSSLPSPSSHSAHNNMITTSSHPVLDKPSLRSPHSSLIHSHLSSRESPTRSGRVSLRNSPKHGTPPSTREMISPAPSLPLSSFTPQSQSQSQSQLHVHHKNRNNSPIGVATGTSTNTSFSLPGSKAVTAAHGRTLTTTPISRNTTSPTNIIIAKKNSNNNDNNKETVMSTPISMTSSSFSCIVPRSYTILSDPKRVFASTSTSTTTTTPQANQGQTGMKSKQEQNELLQEEQQQLTVLNSSFSPITGKVSHTALQKDMNTKLHDTNSPVVNTILQEGTEATRDKSKPISVEMKEERNAMNRTKMSNTSFPKWSINYRKTPLNSPTEFSSGNNNNNNNNHNINSVNKFNKNSDDDDYSGDENYVKGSRQYKNKETKTTGLFGEHTTYSDIQAYQQEQEEEEENNQQTHNYDEEQEQITPSKYEHNKSTKRTSRKNVTTTTTTGKQKEPVQVKTNTSNETKDTTTTTTTTAAAAALPSPSSCLPAHLVNNTNKGTITNTTQPALERKTKYDRPWCKNNNNNKGKNDESNDKQSSIWDTLPPNVDPSLAATIKAEIMERSPSVYWEDIAGNVDAKRLLKEAVLLPLLLPELFVGLVQPWRGVLLFGPPGTGKTMLAKAVATSAKTTFFTISASSINTKHYGESEKLMRTLFEMARHYAPSTIFFDEIDALVSTRSTTEHEASRRVKSELLQQMDGLHSTYSVNNSISSTENADGKEGNINTQIGTNTSNTSNQVLVLATTNRPWDLDEAVRRRLEKRIYIPLPDEESRRALITRHLQHLHLTEDVDVEQLVKATHGFSGADITIVLRDAAMMPVRRLIDTYTTEEIAQLKATSQLFVTPVSMHDFTISLQRAQPSVSQESLSEYAKWAATYGST